MKEKEEYYVQEIKLLNKQTEELVSKLVGKNDEHINSFFDLKSEAEHIRRRVSENRIQKMEESSRVENLRSQLLQLEEEERELEAKLEEKEKERKHYQSQNWAEANYYQQKEEQIQQMEKQINVMKKEIKTEVEFNWQLNNEIQSIKGNIWIYIWIKPISEGEKPIIQQVNSKKIILSVPQEKLKSLN